MTGSSTRAWAPYAAQADVIVGHIGMRARAGIFQCHDNKGAGTFQCDSDKPKHAGLRQVGGMETTVPAVRQL